MKVKLLMPIQKKWLDMIISGEKTLEFRNRLLKDMKSGTVVELYESKGKRLGYTIGNNKYIHKDITALGVKNVNKVYEGSGKVRARFTIGRIYDFDVNKDCMDLVKKISAKQMFDWGYDEHNHKYAIEIKDLVVYEEPRELEEFYSVARLKKGAFNYYQDNDVVDKLSLEELYNLVKDIEYETKKQNIYKPLARVTKAPQSTMRILEVE